MSKSATVLSVEVHAGSQPIVKISGQADFHNQHQISEAFEELFNKKKYIIQTDLEDLHYIDSSALSTLIKCADQANKAGGRIELISISKQVSRVLTLCGAAMFFKADIRDVPVSNDDGRVLPSENFWHVSNFCFQASPGAITFARKRVAEVIRSLPLSSSDCHDTLVAVGEALANAIKHGCGCDPQLRITVKCVAGPNRLAIDITDPGKGFHPDNVPPPSPKTLIEGGMGIYIMRELMDEVSFSFDGNTTVRLVKYIPNITSKTS